MTDPGDGTDGIDGLHASSIGSILDDAITSFDEAHEQPSEVLRELDMDEAGLEGVNDENPVSDSTVTALPVNDERATAIDAAQHERTSLDTSSDHVGENEESKKDQLNSSEIETLPKSLQNLLDSPSGDTCTFTSLAKTEQQEKRLIISELLHFLLFFANRFSNNRFQFKAW
jgi:hypothetical protein